MPKLTSPSRSSQVTPSPRIVAAAATAARRLQRQPRAPRACGAKDSWAGLEQIMLLAAAL
jgi:hypothetical protein